MNAKVMKEFVERKSKPITEYHTASLLDKKANIFFSQTPLFVSLSFMQTYSRHYYVYSANIPWLSGIEDVRVSYVMKDDSIAPQEFYVNYSGNTMTILTNFGYNTVYAIAFF